MDARYPPFKPQIVGYLVERSTIQSRPIGGAGAVADFYGARLCDGGTGTPLFLPLGNHHRLLDDRFVCVDLLETDQK